MATRPGKVRVTVDFTVQEFEALEHLVGRAGAKGKGDLLRYVTKLYSSVLAQHEGVKDTVEEGDKVYLALIIDRDGKKRSRKVEEPEW